MTLMTPPPTPPSPSASVYDMSDEEEDEYNTVRQAQTSRGVKLLYSKSKVYVHPSPSAKDNIAGFIALVQQKPAPSTERPTSSASWTAPETPSSSLLLAWVPESSLPSSAYDTYVKVDLSESSEPPRQSYLVPPPPTTSSLSSSSTLGTYAFAVPVSQIYSLLVRPPSLGWWHGSLVVNTRSGGSFPALFFHDAECQSTILQRKRRQKESFDPFGENGGMFWGGDEVLRWLKRYIPVERAEHDLNVYLVEPSEEDRLGFGTKNQAATASGANNKKDARNSRRSEVPDASMDPLTKTLKEARWGLLEKFSQVTTFARRTAQNIVDHPSVPPQARRLIQNPEVQTIQEEFDSARLYLARWAMGIAEQSEKERRQRIWTARDVLEMEETPVGDFEILDMEAGNMSLTDRRRPVTLKEWEGYFDPDSGQLRVTVDEVKERIFHGGLDPDDGVRKEAWLFLLGVLDWHSSSDERAAHLHHLRDEYVRLKAQWWERVADPEPAPAPAAPADVADSTPQLEPSAAYQKEQRLRIEKDVHRTDRHVALFAGEDIPHPDPDSPFADVGTNVHLEQMKDMLLTYNELNRTLGYVQGMSDLLAPVYAVCQDDAVAFWGFVGFMRRMERNFLRSQRGMRAQLLTLDHLVQLMDPQLYEHLQKADSTNFFFFFRMLLVWYKREFEWNDVLRLWETLWTDYLTSGFHLFVALAILEKHRNVIMDHLRGFDEVLKYVNELSGNIDLPSTLLRAETLFRRFERTVEAVDRKAHFPGPSTDNTLRQRNTGSSSQNASQAKKPQRTDVQRVADAREAGRAAEEPATSQSSARGDGRIRGMQRLDEAEQADAVGTVVSPELRALLSREVPVLDADEIRAEGGGVGT